VEKNIKAPTLLTLTGLYFHTTLLSLYSHHCKALK